MIYHYISWAIAPLSSRSFLGRWGIYGVSIFYVLSGLTLFHVYYDKMIPSLTDLKDFYLKRFFRIFPLFWLTILLSSVVHSNTPQITPLILNLTGLFAVVSPSSYIVTGGWSIGNELVFYLFFPVFVFLSKKNKTGFYLVACLIFGTYLYMAFFRLQPSIPLAQEWVTYVNPFNQAFLFLAGFLLGYFFNKREIPPMASLACLIIGLSLFFFYPGSINVAAGMDRVLFTFASILICLAFYKTTFRLYRFPDQILKSLGEASYSVYLIHPIMWFALDDLFHRKLFIGYDHPSPIVLIVSAMVFTLIIGYCLYRYYEVPFMNTGRNLSLKGKIKGAIQPRS
jgi:exopolysaccharide production protein ExoZ